MKAWLALLTGLVFGAGLALSGMTNTVKVLGFLDVFGTWDPDLAFVMGGALLVSLSATPWITRWVRPLLADAFSLPATQSIDRRTDHRRGIIWCWLGFVGLLPGTRRSLSGLRLSIDTYFLRGHGARHVASRKAAPHYLSPQ